MSQIPEPEEWDFVNLSWERRAYLELNTSFEEIARRITREASFSRVRVDPYVDLGPPPGTRRVEFRAAIAEETYDLLFNGRDGLRGRYWQSPSAGDVSTRYLIDSLRRRLLAFADSHRNCLTTSAGVTMDMRDVDRSLVAPSAKIWVQEEGLLPAKLPEGIRGPSLVVKRWARVDVKGAWRWTPTGTMIEVKGAFLKPDSMEYVPPNKITRSKALHEQGFS